LDTAIWLTSVGVATWARYDFDSSKLDVAGIVTVSFSLALVYALLVALFYVIGGWFLEGSFEQVRRIATATLITTLVYASWTVFRPERSVPVSAIAVGGVAALLGMLAVRYVRRSRLETQRMFSTLNLGRTAVLVGAGETGQQLVKSLRADSKTKFQVAGILDDDPQFRRLSVSGVPVLGGLSAMERAVRTTGAEVVIVAVADADNGLLNDVNVRARLLGIDVLVLPPLSALISGKIRAADLRDLNPTDLLRRRPVSVSHEDIQRLVSGRRVLITGAGGSIGSELCRQVHLFNPSAMGCLDRDESALHALQMSLHGRALQTDDSSILADIRDHQRLLDIFKSFKPDVVFHAAALKHLPLLERFPEEAFKTNVQGTGHVLDAAVEAGVDIFINVSTDKAADPTSVLGQSKRLTEQLTAAIALETGRRYVSVRFGNVLGSRGSVLTSFKEQIESGGPVTITDADVSRYFMTISEACQLVLQASTLRHSGDVLVLDMGEPVRIADVARQMIESAGVDCEIVYTGLRPGEKLAEVLFGQDEEVFRTSNPLISRVPVPPVKFEASELAFNNYLNGFVVGRVDLSEKSFSSAVDAAR
jgi:FlaA1/EpsC-like NDP-sugar epimerase